MVNKVEVTRAELKLILEALEDAAVFRDSRSRVLESAHRKARRRAGFQPQHAAEDPPDRIQANAYVALSARLRASAGEWRGGGVGMTDS